jgi:hypothetical protein
MDIISSHLKLLRNTRETPHHLSLFPALKPLHKSLCVITTQMLTLMKSTNSIQPRCTSVCVCTCEPHASSSHTPATSCWPPLGGRVLFMCISVAQCCFPCTHQAPTKSKTPFFTRPHPFPLSSNHHPTFRLTFSASMYERERWYLSVWVWLVLLSVVFQFCPSVLLQRQSS